MSTTLLTNIDGIYKETSKMIYRTLRQCQSDYEKELSVIAQIFENLYVCVYIRGKKQYHKVTQRKKSFTKERSGCITEFHRVNLNIDLWKGWLNF